MLAYKRDVVVVIKIGAYIHGVVILCGCLLTRFYGISGSIHQEGKLGNESTTKWDIPVLD